MFQKKFKQILSAEELQLFLTLYWPNIFLSQNKMKKWIFTAANCKYWLSTNVVKCINKDNKIVIFRKLFWALNIFLSSYSVIVKFRAQQTKRHFPDVVRLYRRCYFIGNERFADVVTKQWKSCGKVTNSKLHKVP